MALTGKVGKSLVRQSCDIGDTDWTVMMVGEHNKGNRFVCNSPPHVAMDFSTFREATLTTNRVLPCHYL